MDKNSNVHVDGDANVGNVDGDTRWDMNVDWNSNSE